MDKEDLTVACVLWQGDFRDRRYSPEWVYRLRAMAARHLPPHRFVCVSNVPVPDVDVLPIGDYPLCGWWAKLHLFAPKLARYLGRRCLYLDLDSVIIGGMAEMALHPVAEGELVSAPPSWRWHGASGGPAGGDGILDRVQSSAMLWRPGEVTDPWAEWTQDVPLTYRGDQDWIGASQARHSTFPGGWFCKLRHCQSGPPRGVKVVASMPWKNDEAARRFEWVREAWC